MTVTLTNTQEVPVTVAFLDPQGKPAPVTQPTYALSGSGVLVQPEAVADPSAAVETLTLTLVAAGPLGSDSLTVTALNAEGVTVSGSLYFSVVPTAATSVTLTPGTPTDKP